MRVLASIVRVSRGEWGAPPEDVVMDSHEAPEQIRLDVVDTSQAVPGTRYYKIVEVQVTAVLP